ncbi:MAG: DUF6496 domain-containing protein, partial [Gemmatimonadales bacterium]
MAARKSSRKTSGRKYSRKASATVGSAMRRRKHGTLKTRGGRKVTSRKQALAIGISEAREKGEKVPRKRASRKTSRKTSSRKSAARTSSRKSSTKKSAGRKTTRKSPARKSGRKSTRTS